VVIVVQAEVEAAAENLEEVDVVDVVEVMEEVEVVEVVEVMKVMEEVVVKPFYTYIELK
jgi:hypothetical protein